MHFGPIYCETPAIIGAFPAEPWNTHTNALIIILGIAALYMLIQRRDGTFGLYALALLLVVTGIGSFLWHGLRTPWALSLDTLPGLATLTLFLYLWVREVYSFWLAGALIVGLVALQFLTVPLFFGAGLPSGGIFVPLGIELAAVGIWLLRRTRERSPDAARYGAWVLVLATTALLARTVDATGLICPWIPWGTHFLWHLCLATSAFLGFLMLSRLRKG